jgi:PTH1 family peptidyl-tRNA hydrolase
MIIIAGLGNPEREYKNTRHNVGFEVINKLAYDYNIGINRVKFSAFYGEGVINYQKVVLIKPQTYMNLSGEAIRDMLNFYKLGPENLIVVYDDTSIDVGDIRIRKKGSAGGHNGMKNIIYHLESDEFLRIRVGIGAKPKEYDLKDYVLSHFSKKEQDDIIDGITKAAEAVAIILKDSVDNAMNKFNKKKEDNKQETEEKPKKAVKAKEQQDKPCESGGDNER